MVRAAAAQMSFRPSMEENYQNTLRFMEEAAAGGAKLVCFPEGTLTQYIMQFAADENGKLPEYAIPLDHPYVQGWKDKCRELGIIGSFAVSLEMNGTTYCSNILIDEKGELLTVAKKNGISTSEHFHEGDYFAPNDDPETFKVVDTSIGRIGIVICFDRHYPESFRTMALKNADLVIIPVTNIKEEPADVFEWEIRIGAFTTGVNAVMINRVGTENGLVMCGRSIFANYKGTAVAAADDTEQVLFADLDLAGTKAFRDNMTYTRLRRPEIFTFK